MSSKSENAHQRSFEFIRFLIADEKMSAKREAAVTQYSPGRTLSSSSKSGRSGSRSRRKHPSRKEDRRENEHKQENLNHGQRVEETQNGTGSRHSSNNNDKQTSLNDSTASTNHKGNSAQEKRTTGPRSLHELNSKKTQESRYVARRYGGHGRVVHENKSSQKTRQEDDDRNNKNTKTSANKNKDSDERMMDNPKVAKRSNNTHDTVENRNGDIENVYGKQNEEQNKQPEENKTNPEEMPENKDNNSSANTEKSSNAKTEEVDGTDRDSPEKNQQESEEDEFLRMFLSSEQMDRGDEDGPGRGRDSRGGRRAAWQYTEEGKKKHEEMIRKILEEFDLEACKEKYRNAYVIETHRKGNRMVDYQFRAELERMMGSEVIRLNDKSWSKKFTAKLLEDYHKFEEDQDRRRREGEQLRQHKLHVLGLIKEEKPIRRRLTAAATRSSKRDSMTETIQRYKRNLEMENRRTTLAANQQNTTYKHPVETKIVDTFDEGQQVALKRYQKGLPQPLQRLYEEESVDGLYKLAEELVIFR